MVVMKINGENQYDDDDDDNDVDDDDNDDDGDDNDYDDVDETSSVGKLPLPWMGTTSFINSLNRDTWFNNSLSDSFIFTWMQYISNSMISVYFVWQTNLLVGEDWEPLVLQLGKMSSFYRLLK